MLDVLNTTVGFSDVLKLKSFSESVLESVPESKSVPPSTTQSLIIERRAKSIALLLPAEEVLAFQAWVTDAKPSAAELHEIRAELREDMASMASLEHGLKWMYA